MAAPEGSLERQKAELTATLALSRRELSTDLDQVADALDVSSQLKRSFNERSWQWLAVALAAGAISGMALMPRAKKVKKGPGGIEIVKKRSIAGTVLKFAAQNAFMLAQPALTRIAKEHLESLVKNSLHRD